MRRECRERFPPPPISKETASWRSRHASRHVRDARAVMHVGIAYLRWRGNRSRHSRRMRTRNFTYLARGPCNPGHNWCITFMQLSLSIPHVNILYGHILWQESSRKIPYGRHAVWIDCQRSISEPLTFFNKSSPGDFRSHLRPLRVATTGTSPSWLTCLRYGWVGVQKVKQAQ